MSMEHIEQEQVTAKLSRISEIDGAQSGGNFEIGQLACELKAQNDITDAVISEKTGVDAKHIADCRRVWETFGEHFVTLRKLTWSHFRHASGFKNPLECAQWADENEASVREMRAWYAAHQPASEQSAMFEPEQQRPAESTEAPKRRGPKKSKATPAPETEAKKKGGGKKSEPEKQPQLESAKATGKPPGGVNFNPPDWEEQKDDEPDIEGFVSKFDETVQRVRTEEQRQELISKVRARLELLERPGKTAAESILQEFPGLAQNERFASVFRDWLKMRRRERWTVKEDYIRHTLRRLSDGTGTAAIDSLQNSVDQRWRGVFINEKGKGGKSERIRIDGGESEEWVPDEDHTVEAERTESDSNRSGPAAGNFPANLPGSV